MFPRSKGRGPIETRLAGARAGRLRRFHVRKDVAPLKLYSCPREADVWLRFHVRKDVAPLKRRPRRKRFGRSNLFPRSKGRGPIETSALAGMSRAERLMFPRSKGRGPIETTTVAEEGNSLTQRFHVRKDVAPLKPR